MKYNHLPLAVALLIATSCNQNNEIKPERKTIVDAVFGSGHIENNSQYTVMANAEGFIKSAFIVEGDSVKKGELLFRLSNEVQQAQVGNALTNLNFAETNTLQNSPQIEQLKIQIFQAQAKYSVDSANYQRYARLVKTQAVSVTDYENARLTNQNSLSSLKVLVKNLADLKRNLNLSLDNARAQFKIQKETNNYYNIISDGSGLVMNVAKKTGDYVKKGDALALLGAGGIIIKLDIAEEDIARIKLGMPALISLNSLKDKIYKARITKIYPSFNNTEQAFIVEAAFEDEPGKILNGTQLQANIIIGQKNNALVIPSFYLFNDDEVMIAAHKQKKRVTIGIRTLEWTEITSGISEKDILTLPKSN